MRPSCLALWLLLAVVATSSAASAGQPNKATKEFKQELLTSPLDLLLQLHGDKAKEAYNTCKNKYGEACQVPCSSLGGCAGCHPGSSGALECAFCLPGHIMSADKSSCTACPTGSTSPGGTDKSCQACAADTTTDGPGAYLCVAKPPTPSRDSQPRVTQEIDACITYPCPDGGQPIKPICTDRPDIGEPSIDDSTAGRDCTCPSLPAAVRIRLRMTEQGCEAIPRPFNNGLFNEDPPGRCAVQLSAPGLRQQPCTSSPVKPGTNGACQQVSIIEGPPLASICGNNTACGPDVAGCWQFTTVGVPGYTGGVSGWFQAGPSCSPGSTPNDYLGPCPSPSCTRPPASTSCTVVNSPGLTMRTAPCAYAPPVTGLSNPNLPAGATFEFLDQNSRQVSSCGQYGYAPQETAFCWVQGTYQGVTGWLPVYETQPGRSFDNALCLAPPTSVIPLVSDQYTAAGLPAGQSQGCAALQCFPAAAKAMLRDGSSVSMFEVKLGDEVAVVRSDGSVGFEPVYAFGHRDPTTEAPFIELTVSSMTRAQEHTLQASADHFVLARSPEGPHKLTYKRAGEVAPGDIMVVTPDLRSGLQQPKAEEAVVVASRVVVNTGLYAPLTLGGNIVVDGVAASVHSAWFADALFKQLGLPDSWLPPLYQAVLAPVRLLWWYMPGYAHYYQMMEDTSDLHDSTSSFTGLCCVLAKVLFTFAQDAAASLVPDVKLLLTGSAGFMLVCAAVLMTSRTGGPAGGSTKPPAVVLRRYPTRVASTVLMAVVVVLALSSWVAPASAARHADSAPHGGPAVMNDATASAEPKGYDHYPEDNQHFYTRVGEPHHSDEYENKYDRDPEYELYERPRGGSHGHEACQGRPPLLPFGVWQCSCGSAHGYREDYRSAEGYSKCAVGYTHCNGVCSFGSGAATDLPAPKIQCKPYGWSQVTGSCPSKPLSCPEPPTTPLDAGGTWPNSCAGLGPGEWCFADCSDVFGGNLCCHPVNVPAVQCRGGRWSRNVYPTGAFCPTVCSGGK